MGELKVNDPDLEKAIELLKQKGKVSRIDLEMQYNWSWWRSRRAYEKLRWLCETGMLECEALFGYVEMKK
ncbi:hypothetical protein [Sulfurisphaera ohwakuensis]|uniref:Putative dehydrogenase n=1 Tax=Sulfurisphaera ohwakuensis TaxID=69656 RepID=A0A650CJ47_SULOH|nr:hypothetical protein [Sulfurisphaera ohwakuensis]MBB5253510.1 putative dehydrogenase [Sulfurisphaera ohwakuensis]QGR17816.1 hypothetical protein D1869_11985 [Sulfurisphaera ohwakuensis]